MVRRIIEINQDLCNGCGKCLRKCPQKLDIIEELKKVKKEFEYSGTNLVSIRDYAAGETTFDTPVTFNVTGNRLNSICGSGNDTDRIEFGYTDDRLTSINYYSRISGSDVLVNTVEIEYRSNGNIYKIYSAVDDERIIFLFDSDDKIYKIIKKEIQVLYFYIFLKSLIVISCVYLFSQ